MTSILFHLFFNPWALGGLAVAIAIAAALYFLLGPVRFLKIALDLRTWAVLAGVLAVLGFAHQEKRYNDMAAKLDTAVQQNTATVDAQKTTELRMDQKAKRADQNSRVRVALAKAKPADAEDAVMDAIAAERGDPISSGPAPVLIPATKAAPPPQPEVKASAPEVKAAAPAPKAKKPQPEIKKNDPVPAPQVADRAPDRAAGAAGDRLRKRPDVVVVP